LFLAVQEKYRKGTMPIRPTFDAPFYLPEVDALDRAVLFAAPGNHRNGLNHLPFGPSFFSKGKSGCLVGLMYQLYWRTSRITHGFSAVGSDCVQFRYLNAGTTTES
jgi:hypothetical protein